MTAAVAFFLYSFVGTFVFGLFLYYGMRPIDERLRRVLDRPGVTAGVTVVTVVVPILLVLSYVVVVGLGQLGTVNLPAVVRESPLLQSYVDLSALPTNAAEFRAAVWERLRDGDTLQEAIPGVLSLLGAVANGLLNLFLSLLFTFFLLRDDDRLVAWFETGVGAEGTLVHDYLKVVDASLRSVYYGVFLTALLVTLFAAVVYLGLDLIAPPGVDVPLPVLLALLTGLATFVPVLVGKIVYVPLVGYLTVVALDISPLLLWFPVLALVVSFLFLDLLPVMVIGPYLAGRTVHRGLMYFAYILGPVLFGWYGIFLGPLLLTLLYHFYRLVFPDLVRASGIE
jgi:predicted PurR-regulated permease PerM